MRELDKGLSDAVCYFWRMQQRPNEFQGTSTGRRDAGRRSAVTGGGHCTGFADLTCKLLGESGIPDAEVFYRRVKPEMGQPRRDPRFGKTVLPGFFRPIKTWDLLVVCDGERLAVLEFKSQIGSLGNNANNRAAFRPSAPPWLGYFMLLEDTPAAFEPVRTPEPHFPVFPEFKDASYCKRYELLCERLVRATLRCCLPDPVKCQDRYTRCLSRARTGIQFSEFRDVVDGSSRSLREDAQEVKAPVR